MRNGTRTRHLLMSKATLTRIGPNSYYADDATMHAHQSAWRLDEVRQVATVAPANEPGLTLGIATGTMASVEAQLDRKVQVVKAMQERISIA